MSFLYVSLGRPFPFLPLYSCLLPFHHEHVENIKVSLRSYGEMTWTYKWRSIFYRSMHLRKPSLPYALTTFTPIYHVPPGSYLVDWLGQLGKTCHTKDASFLTIDLAWSNGCCNVVMGRCKFFMFTTLWCANTCPWAHSVEELRQYGDLDICQGFQSILICHMECMSTKVTKLNIN